MQTLYCFEEAYKEAVNVTEDEEKREIRMERKVSGDWKKLQNFVTERSLWQQDITFKERGAAGGKAAALIGITAWLFITGRYGLCRH